jgi:hypothetical protein
MRPQTLTRLAVTSLALVAPLFSTGCQATVGGQTLPSAWYLEDDVQYFPAGPEFKLTNLKERLDQYRLEQQGLADDVQDGF